MCFEDDNSITIIISYPPKFSAAREPNHEKEHTEDRSTDRGKGTTVA